MEMVTSVFAFIGSAIAALPFSGPTWFVLFLLAFFVWLFYKAHRNPTSVVNWEDLIVDSVTHKVSPYKMGYLLGLVTGTFIVLTYMDKGTLSFDIFGLYLAYLLGGAGWTNFLQQKTTAATIETKAAMGKFDDVNDLPK